MDETTYNLYCNLLPYSSGPTYRWKAADLFALPDLDINKFGWENKVGIPSPCMDPGHTGPPALMDIISYHCRMKENPSLQSLLHLSVRG